MTSSISNLSEPDNSMQTTRPMLIPVEQFGPMLNRANKLSMILSRDEALNLGAAPGITLAENAGTVEKTSLSESVGVSFFRPRVPVQTLDRDQLD